MVIDDFQIKGRPLGGSFNTLSKFFCVKIIIFMLKITPQLCLIHSARGKAKLINNIVYIL